MKSAKVILDGTVTYANGQFSFASFGGPTAYNGPLDKLIQRRLKRRGMNPRANDVLVKITIEAEESES